MTDFRIATKYNKETEGEKCPNCRYIFQNFLDVGTRLNWGPGILWACLGCGLVFIPKKARMGIKASIKMIVQHQMEAEKQIEAIAKEETEDASNVCPECGFLAKSKVGFVAHMRKHKKIQHG